VLIGLACLAVMATCSEDTSVEQTQKVQQDQQPEEDHQSIKRDAVEDYGAEESYAPSAIAGGEAYAHAAPAEAYAPAAHGSEAYAPVAQAAEAYAPSAAEGYAPSAAEAYGPSAYAAAPAAYASPAAYAGPTAYAAAAAPVGIATAPAAYGYGHSAYPSVSG